MPSRIRILPENLANRIAAGEVVERPAAVVKELVENSIDAGATDVLVEIEKGGKRLIKVVDNGCGMSRDDALLSFERHATSKLAADSNLSAIPTLGFRGEALPSIASVSRMTLATLESDSIEGVEIYCEGGRIQSVKSHGMAPGTSIEIRSLFFNTPARLKFMRSSETESGHVSELLLRLAISRPDVRFTYLSDGKTQFRVAPGDLRARVAALLSKESLRDLWPVNVSEEGVSVTGLVGGPSLTRSTASGLYAYINGRFIRDKVIQHAVIQAYRGVIDKGRYPLVVLFIEIPLEEVDVNVHPTKHEVRFREQGKVHDIIFSAVSSQLSRSPWVRQVDGQRPCAGASVANVRIDGVRDALATYGSRKEEQLPVFRALSTSIPKLTGAVERGGVPEPPKTVSPAGYYSSLAVIGQYKSMYILCQDGIDLVLVDQHAAHERIAFQQLRREFASTGVESQILLFPETVELTYVESAAISEHAAMIDSLGFEIGNFGGTTHVITAVPRIVASSGYLPALREILEELGQLSRTAKADQLLDSLLARLACHSVVRGNRTLQLQEIQALFRQMDETDFAGTCPHGRPVLIRITLAEIEKMFRRSRSVAGE